jgi:hypothetical protein
MRELAAVWRPMSASDFSSSDIPGNVARVPRRLRTVKTPHNVCSANLWIV